MRFATTLSVMLFACGDDGRATGDAATNDGNGDSPSEIDAAIDASPPVPPVQIYVKASDAAAGGVFGFSVSIAADGNTLAVGAFGANSVYVFSRDAGRMWSETAIVHGSNIVANDEFGEDVALSADGSTLAVAATGPDRVYVFARNGSTWTEQKKIDPPAADVAFGAAIAISGDGNVLAVGAVDDDTLGMNAGAAYVYARTGTTWGAPAKLTAAIGGFFDHFGTEVALDGDGGILAIGAPGEDSDGSGPMNNSLFEPGAIYVFARNGATWSQQAYVKTPTVVDEALLGTRLALASDGTRLAAGAIGESNRTGAVYLLGGASWSQEARLVASNPGAMDAFGFVAMSPDGEHLIAGAYDEGSGAMGLDGDGADNSALESGAAYVFSRHATAWSQDFYVKPSNTFGYQQFGYATAFADDGTFVVGSHTESGASQGIGGDQTQNLAATCGAVYIFQQP